MKRILPVIIGFSVAVPMMASALTLSEMVNLFISLGIIPADKQAAALSIVQQETTGVGSPVTNIPDTTSSVCPYFATNLYRGVRGEDVSSLQRFLATTGDYTYGEVTGYYGSATEAAVQRYQVRTGIVSYGSAATTGYGVVGPATREYIRTRCGITPTPTGVLSTTPTTGTAPLSVTFSGAWSSIDFGDGQNAASSNLIQGFVHTYSHTYTQPGTYTAVSGGKSVTITVSGTPQQTFMASPSYGAVPLTVIFSGAKDYITYGDGQGGPLSSSVISVAHIYTTPGTYTATSNGQSVTITVTGSATTLSERFSVEKTLAANTVIAEIVVTIPQNSVEVCGPIVVGTIYWGDGSAEERPTRLGCSGSSSTVSVPHTYSKSGTYTVTFIGASGKRQEQTVTIGATNWKELSLTATPTTGVAPLMVAFSGSYCGGATIGFGDGSSSINYSVTDAECGSFQLNHTYNSPGTYTAWIQSSYGGGYQRKEVPVTVVTAEEAVALSVSATYGSLPLGVTITASTNASYFGGTRIDLGDGTTASCTQPGGSGSCTIKHTYNNSGTYSVRYLGVGEGSTTTIAQQTVTVVHSF